MRNLFQKIEPAKILWEDGAPVSASYGDIYYSRGDGLEETRYIFLGLNRLEERWKALPPAGQFTIAETGFGTGLNFLAAVRLWLEVAPPKARLHFISVEKHPLVEADLKKALCLWPELAAEAGNLLASYPPLTPGYHRRNLFHDRVSLTLVFDDIENCLPQATWQADAWFLDGFAPSGNPSMWSDTVLGQLGRLSKPDATAATFTVAGFVRRGLQSQGFKINKVPGFGKKREVSVALMQAEERPPTPAPRFRDKPWFIAPPQQVQHRSATVIGAGLAGCSVAQALASRHWQVELLDTNATLAGATSGNHAGIIYTRFSPHNSAQNRFYQQSFLFTSKLIKQLAEDGQLSPGDWDNCGVLQTAFSGAEKEKQQELLANNHCPESVLKHLNSEEAGACAGFNNSGGIFLEDGGWIHPPALCEALVQHDNIGFSGAKEVASLEYDDRTDLWTCYDARGEALAQSEVVVIANALAANRFSQTAWLPLKPISGQISLLDSNHASEALKTVVCYDGYVSPAYKNLHSTGATFHLDSTSIEVTPDDHKANLEKLSRDFPAFAQTAGSVSGGRSGIRCQTPDYMPVAGRVPVMESLQELYAGYGKGRNKGTLQSPGYYSGLYCLAALGSRGICFAPYAAEILASQINNEPIPVDGELANHLSPTRFAIKQVLNKTAQSR